MRGGEVMYMDITRSVNRGGEDVTGVVNVTYVWQGKRAL